MVDPVLLDIPDQFESERLIIRVPRAGDGPGVNEAVVESIDSLRVWMPWARTTPTLAESESNCRKARAKFILREDIILRLYLKDDRTVVGSSGLHYIEWDIPRFEIGYWIRKRFEGQGYAAEAVRAITRFATEQLHARRLEIHCASHNDRSCRVAERAGYQLESIRVSGARTMAGEICDMRVYTRIPPAGG